MKRGSRAAIMLCVALAAPCALAQSAPSSSDSLLREGVELRRQGRDADALGAFTRAYAIDGSPIALAQMGLAEQALGRWGASETHVRGALASHGNAWIEQNRPAIEQAYVVIVRHTGTIELTGLTPGAQVIVDGEAAGTAPLTELVHAAAGDVTLEVRAEGYLPIRRVVRVRAGETTQEHVAMARENTSPAILRPLAYASAGLAVAGLVVGIAAVVVHENAIADYNNDPYCPGLDAGYQPLVCMDRINRADAMRSLEIAGFVGAGVFAAAGAAMWFLAPHDETRSARGGVPVRVACGGGPGAVGIACTIRY